MMTFLTHDTCGVNYPTAGLPDVTVRGRSPAKHVVVARHCILSARVAPRHSPACLGRSRPQRLYINWGRRVPNSTTDTVVFDRGCECNAYSGD